MPTKFTYFMICLVFPYISSSPLLAANERDVYSWTEPKGIISFGDVPPPGIKSNKILTKPATGKPKVLYEEAQSRQQSTQDTLEAKDHEINQKVQERNNFLMEQQKENHRRNCARVKLNQESLASIKNPANPEFHQKLLEQNQKDIQQWCGA